MILLLLVFYSHIYVVCLNSFLKTFFNCFPCSGHSVLDERERAEFAGVRASLDARVQESVQGQVGGHEGPQYLRASGERDTQ